MQPITIILEGGIIQNIENIPPGMTIQVRNFDTDESEDAAPEDVQYLEDGTPYTVTTWV